MVHEEPDLAGVPPELAPLLTACLAKDPALRPTAAELSGQLAERGGRIGRWPEECPTVLAGELTEAEHSARTLVDTARPSVATPTGQESAPTVTRSDTLLAAPAAPGRGGRRTWLWAAAAAAAAAVAAVGVVAATDPFGTERSSAESSPSAPEEPSGPAAPVAAGKTPSASVQEPGESQEPQTSQAPQAPQGESAALKVVRAMFELATGESVAAGARTLIMQEDGNLVVYDQDRKPRWAAMTGGKGNYARFQPDGNLVVYNSGGRPLWASRSDGHEGAVLVFQADGNMVIRSGDTVHWAAGTEN
ncbi:hypothetical protein [Streptomyces sp. NPDC127033]|uniref:hypothetical protein n=1 Tax=Streptomyces sp. NPDC127033 TaxID=3347110 RepID=UPI0036510325